MYNSIDMYYSCLHPDIKMIATLQALCPLLSFVPNDGDGHTAFTFPLGLGKARERGCDLCGGPAPPHSLRSRDTPFPLW